MTDGLTPDAVLAAPVASVPEHRVRPARPAPGEIPHIYVPTWRDRNLGWLDDFLAKLDPEGLGRLVGSVTDPVTDLFSSLLVPVDSVLTAVGSAAGSVITSAGALVGRVVAAVPAPAPLRRWFAASDAASPTASGVALQETVKERYDSMVWIGMIAAVGVHAAAFTLSPTMQAEDFSVLSEQLTAVEIPPEIEIPPPPQQIARPATPVIAAGPVDENITIAPTTFEDNPVDDLPPPPDVAAPSGPESQPAFTPFTVAPRVLNSDAVVRMLDAEYPPALRDSGIGGVVVIWFHIDQEGRLVDTQLFQTSGFEQLDTAALRVAPGVEFSPALNRDQPASVWIQLPLEFRVR